MSPRTGSSFYETYPAFLRQVAGSGAYREERGLPVMRPDRCSCCKQESTIV